MYFPTEVLDKQFKKPPFLNDQQKWNEIVELTDTSEKFEALMWRLLYKEYLNAIDFYKIIKLLHYDITAKHKTDEITVSFFFIEHLFNYIIKLLNNYDKFTNENILFK